MISSRKMAFFGFLTVLINIGLFCGAVWFLLFALESFGVI